MNSYKCIVKLGWHKINESGFVVLFYSNDKLLYVTSYATNDPTLNQEMSDFVLSGRLPE